MWKAVPRSIRDFEEKGLTGKPDINYKYHLLFVDYMIMEKYRYVLLIIIIAFGTSGLYMSLSQKNSYGVAEGAVITLYKTESCNCCKNYIRYLKNNSYKVDIVRINDLRAEFMRFGVPQDMFSCHIAETSGYFLVGHIPVVAINKLLKEKPEIDGIALPGMPSGSPGMGGEKIDLFVIYYLSGKEAGVYLEV